MQASQAPSSKQPIQYPNWVFTAQYGGANQASQDSIEAVVEAVIRSKAKYVLFGRETAPTTGQKHLQGYVQFKAPQRLTQVAKMLPCHWEPAKADDEKNFEYCTKDGDFVEWGERTQINPGKREQARWDEARAALVRGDLAAVDSQIFVCHYSNCKLIAKDYMITPDMLDAPTGVWYWGEAGAGKSFKAREDYPEAYLKLANKWWDGYQLQEFVILDDFGLEHSCLGHHLKIWADRYSFVAEVKGGAIAIRPKKIVITSQYSIDDIWSDKETRDALKRRFKVVHFGVPGDAPALLRAAFNTPQQTRAAATSPPSKKKKASAPIDLTGSDEETEPLFQEAQAEESDDEELKQVLPLRRSTAGQFRPKQ